MHKPSMGTMVEAMASDIEGVHGALFAAKLFHHFSKALQRCVMSLQAAYFLGLAHNQSSL